MQAMNTVQVQTQFGEKSISVFTCDIVSFDMEIDILTTSAFRGSYAPTPRTMFRALTTVGIDAEILAENPAIDLRDTCGVWLSKEITGSELNIGRLGCIEMSNIIYDGSGWKRQEGDVLAAIKAYFQMLDLAATGGIKMRTVALPMLGAGSQRISDDLTLIPMIRECIDLLKRNSAVEQIYFIDYNQRNAFKIALALQNSYLVKRDDTSVVKSFAPAVNDSKVFISYTTNNRNVADNLCAKLEARGMKVWYAPRNVRSNGLNDYASAIVEAISTCTHFVVIISRDSMLSEHVLNEIDLAFKELQRNIKFYPLRIDEEEMRPAFSYYLSRQHWMDAHDPPLEKRLEEFVNEVIENN